MYLYRAVDSGGNTLDFLLSAPRDAQAVHHFLVKTLYASHTVPPCVITVDKNAEYPKALYALYPTKDLSYLTEGLLPI